MELERDVVTGVSMMLCPHCDTQYHSNSVRIDFLRNESERKNYSIIHNTCPSCAKPSVHFQIELVQTTLIEYRCIYPQHGPGRAAPKEVEDLDPDLARDYNEAAAILQLSPRASAVLSKSCLCAVLSSQIPSPASPDVACQIREYAATVGAPENLKALLMALLQLGIVASASNKDSSDRKIKDAALVEAEMLLDTLDSLFEYVYVLPAKQKFRIDRLNRKLAEAKRPIIPFHEKSSRRPIE